MRRKQTHTRRWSPVGPCSDRHEPPHIGTSRHSAPTGALSRGFTLVEMIVAIGLFAVVMVVCVTALLSLVHANRKAQALQSVMNNLNIALDGMVRSVRMGSNYDGSRSCSSPIERDCPEGGPIFIFKSFDGNNVAYVFDSTTHRLERATDGNPANAVPITVPEVSIDEMLFYVVGTKRSDTIQPRVVIVINGSAGSAGTTARTTFHIQATAVQRVLDL